jgi:O-succinylbenzoic acid--CoA ligase
MDQRIARLWGAAVIDWGFSVPHPLLAARAAGPSRTALIAVDGRWTYAELVDAVACRAAGYAARGVVPGATVVIEMHRRGDDLINLHALGWLGAVAAPIQSGLNRAARATVVAALQADHDLGAVADCEPLEPRPWPLTEPRLVVATSGTSGAPRAVILGTAQLLFSASGSAIRLGHDPDDRWLCPLPLHHIGGLSAVLRPMIYGTTAEVHERFDPAMVAAALDRGRITQVSLVPTMLERVLDARPARPFPPRLRTILVGGAAVSTALMERGAQIGAPIARSWGLSEAASQVATASPGTSGAVAPLPFLEILSCEGRLMIRGPAAGGEVVTDDLGSLDPLGRVTVRGRADALIVRGGENIDPTQVESVLRAHPAVASAYVVGLPDAVLGERLGAVLVAAGIQRPDAAEMRAWCAHQLEKTQVPERLLWVAEPPRSALAKVRLGELRQLLISAEPGR